MTSFFYQTAQSLINQYPDRFPLLKITHLLDWKTIEAKLQSKKIGGVLKSMLLVFLVI